MNLAYYNENDPKTAAWLRELIGAGLIADGIVDERSICDIQPEYVRGFVQCHFFAGIGGWSLALRLAGWPDSRSVWTGSCPCQPFSKAGKQKATNDARNLWPQLRRLISERNPSTIFGEQVASPLGREWLSGVRTDVEELGYALGASDLCASGVNAPHPRQRLYWVANANDPGPQGRRRAELCERPGERAAGQGGDTGWMGNTDSDGAERSGRTECKPDAAGEVGGLVNSNSSGRNEGLPATETAGHRHSIEPAGGNGFWSEYDVAYFRDGKSRRIEPGSFPLAHGVPGRVGLLRGYGNAIVPQVAAEFVQAYLETVDQ